MDMIILFKNVFIFIVNMFFMGIHVHSKPRQLRHGNVSPAGGMGETKGSAQEKRRQRVGKMGQNNINICSFSGRHLL